MLYKIDYYLAGFTMGLNFLLFAMEQNCLLTILPKYFGNQTTKQFINQSINFQSNHSNNCTIQNPPYVIISFIFLSRNIALLITNPIIGIIISKFNIFVVLVTGHAIGVSVAFIYAYGNTVWTYVIGRILEAIVTSVIYISVYALISRLFTNKKVRDRYYGIVPLFSYLSYSIHPLYGAKIDEYFGKVAVFQSTVPIWIICSLSTILLYWKIRRNERKSTKTVSKSNLNFEQPNPINSDEIDEVDNYENKPMNSQSNVYAIDLRDTQGQVGVKSTKTIKTQQLCFSMFAIMKDGFVIACVFQIFVAHLSVFAYQPTLPGWMAFRLCSSESEQGMVWIFGFLGYICGIGIVIVCRNYFSKMNLYIPIMGHIIVGVLLILLPFVRDWRLVFIPIMAMYMSIGIVIQVIVPHSMNLVMSRYQSNYAAMSSLISQAVASSAVVSTLTCGYISERMGFHSLSILVGVINLVVSPISLIHLKIKPTA